MQFLFMDEATSEPIPGVGRLAIVTGVVIPLSQYGPARTRFYTDFGDRRTANGITVDLAPLELHGRRLLPGAPDDEKIAALNKVTDIALDLDFAIYRFGYVDSASLRATFNSDDVALGLSWLDLLFAVQCELRKGPLMPIADGGNPRLAEHMTRSVRNMDVLREGGHGPNLSIRDTENIIGEVFFGDSKYSAFVQVADIVSYLLLQRDMRRLGWPTTPFKERVLSVADRLIPAIRSERIARARMQGSVMVMEPLDGP